MEQELNIHIGIRLKQKRIEKNLTQTKVEKLLMLHFNKFKNMKKEPMD